MAPTPPDLPPFDVWRRQLAEALDASRRPRTIAATALTDDGRPDVLADPGLHKRPRDLDLPPWQKGRYGSAVGRAVHGVLQTIDLGGADDDAIDRRRGGLAGRGRGHPRPRGPHPCPGRRGAGLADGARGRGGPPLARGLRRACRSAATARSRATSTCCTGGPTGWSSPTTRRGPPGRDADLDPLVARYRTQGASYALAVAAATGEPVVAVVFVFLTPEGPVDRPLADLDAAVAEVRTLAEAGDDRLVTT